MKTILIKKLSFLFLLFFTGIVPIMAQGGKISLGKTDIGSNEAFQITATVENDRLKNYSGFPEIPGFRKSGTSSSTSTNIINGQVSSSQSVTQNYEPTKEGTFTLAPFQMNINGKNVQGPGATIKVGPPVQRQVYDPFADFWGRPRNDSNEFIDVQDDAFFSITTNKNEVYVGEGFTMNIAFYVSLQNRAAMDFYKIGEQLADILKKVKPINCWEENFGIESVSPEYIVINGKQYRQYKIYEAAFYPLNARVIDIPTVGLKMVKYKVAKRQSLFGQNRQEDFKTFYSSPKKVLVKELPPHPLRDKVAVGNYELIEKFPTEILETGKAFSYNFTVRGEGNISSIGEPEVPDNPAFIFYPPSTKQNITRSNGTVFGAKTFEYFVEPQEPGSYNFGELFQLIYFNTKKEKYDTLASTIDFVVGGESKKDAQIQSSDLGGFYDRIVLDDNQLRDLSASKTSQWAFNTFLGLLMLVSLVMAFVKFKK